ncbi:MAG: 50S ribosomal protein L18 [Planctomycetota bacterium]
MDPNKRKAVRRLRRRRHIRKNLLGTPERPRLSITRSHQHISCQVIDDTQGRTLSAASTLEKELRGELGKDSGNRKGAEIVGTRIAGRLKELGITQIKFDRNGYKYHGRVAALADAMRKEGIEV